MLEEDRNLDPENTYSLIPPKDMEPEKRLELALSNIGRLSNHGLLGGDEIDHMFKAEKALGEGDMETFDNQILLAFKDLVYDESDEARLEWTEWLLRTLSVLDQVPPEIQRGYLKARDRHERGEETSALLGTIKRMAEDLLSDNWYALRKYTKRRYKEVKRDLDGVSRSQVKHLMSRADLMWSDGSPYCRRRALRLTHEAHEILFREDAILGGPLRQLG